MAEIVFKLASLDHAMEYAVGFLRKNERDLSLMTSLATWPCWPASRWISDDGHIPWRRPILIAFFLNNLTGTSRCNYINSTYVARQTAEWCFDSS